MTAKQQLKRAVDDLTEEEAGDVLQFLVHPRDLTGEAATAILDSIPGAWESVQRGLQDMQAGRTVSLDDLLSAG